MSEVSEALKKLLAEQPGYTEYYANYEEHQAHPLPSLEPEPLKEWEEGFLDEWAAEQYAREHGIPYTPPAHLVPSPPVVPTPPVVPAPQPVVATGPIVYAEDIPVVPQVAAPVVPAPLPAIHRLNTNRKEAPWKHLTIDQHAQYAMSFLETVPDISAAVEHAKPMEWVVEGMLPRGGLVLLGGQAKLGRKSLFCMHLALTIADAQGELLGRPTRHGSVVLANLEDGFVRGVRRLRDFGVRPGDYPHRRACPIFFVTSLDQLDLIPSLLRCRAVECLVIDPLVELGNHMGLENENDAGEVSWFLRPWRELAHESGALILLTHHFRKDGDMMRGSTALEGACDGWLELHHLGEGKPHLLQGTPRDAEPFEQEIMITYGEQGASINAVSESRPLTSNPATLRKSYAKEDGDGHSGSSKKGQSSPYEVYMAVAKYLSGSPSATFSANDLAGVIGAPKGMIKAALAQLVADGNAKDRGHSKGWQWALPTPSMTTIMGNSTTPPGVDKHYA